MNRERKNMSKDDVVILNREDTANGEAERGLPSTSVPTGVRVYPPSFAVKNVRLHNVDCMDFMRSKPDNYYDLAIVDPPYGIGVGGSKPFGSVGGSNICHVKTYKTFDDSKPPSPKYFTELMRVSKNQIIWGGNYFVENLTNSSCWVVWDKDNSGNFADCELAWTSFNTAVRKYKFKWNGMLQENMKNKEERVHPTQKPINLYKWLLKNYANDGNKIIDTHGGSFSSAIACYLEGFEYDGCELDRDYYQDGCKRFDNMARQESLFPAGGA